MPNLFTLPGPRSGADNFASQYLFSGLVTVGSGTTINASLERVYWSDHYAASFENHGTIWNVSNSNIGATLAGFYLSRIVNTGTMIAQTVNGNATGIFNGSHGDTVSNSGSIYAIANGNAAGIEHWGPSVHVNNSGTIVAYAPTASTGSGGGGVGAANAVTLFNGGVLTNNAGASILAEGIYATAVMFGRGSLFGTHAIRNDGRIEASVTAPGQLSYGIMLGGLAVETHVLVNNGLIRADVAWSSFSTDQLYGPRTMDLLTNSSSGTIIGRIETGRGQDVLVNSGLIVGTIDLGDENDRLDISGGTLTGSADLGWHADVFIGSAGADVVTGNRGDDNLAGNGGNDLLLGGVGHDMISGGAGNDGLYGELGEDHLITNGGDRAYGGDGDDVLEARDLSFALISGGAGNDTLRLNVGALALDLGAAIATGRLSGIERLDLLADQQIALRAGNASSLASGTIDIVSGVATSQVALVGGWVEGAQIARDGILCRSFRLGAETIFIAATVGISVVGSMPPNFTGLADIAAGAAAPIAGSLPGGALANPVLTITALHLDRPIDVDAGETWLSTNLPVIMGFSLSAGLINGGLIEMRNNTATNTTITNDIATIFNTGTIRSIATGTVGTGAINVRGMIENYGTIESMGEGHVLALNANALGEGAVLNNHGTISARSTAGDAFAVQITGSPMPAGPVGLNAGLIEAVGGTRAQALFVSGGTFINASSGTIVASNTAGSGATNAVAVLFYNANTWSPFNRLINDGAINGRIAIRSELGIDDVVNSGWITGTILLEGGADSLENRGDINGRISLGEGADRYLGASARSAVEVDGGTGIDLLVGGIHADRLEGGDGNDLLIGGAGADILLGGTGADRFWYGSVSDSTATASDLIQGFESGIDRIELVGLAPSSITLGLAAGVTTVTAQTATGTLTIRVAGTIVQGDVVVIASSGALVGTAGDDILFATLVSTGMAAGDGNDLLVGNGGNDRLDGGLGADVMVGGGGNDVYIVDNASDRVVERDGEGIDHVFVSATFTLSEGLENVTLLAAANVTGNALDNIILGSANDDSIFGGAGADLITGGLGSDFLGGGTGVDRYIYRSAAESTVAAPDRISGFETGIDRIDLSAILVTSIRWDRYATQFEFYDRVTIQTGSGTMELRLNLADRTIPLSMADFILGPAPDARNDYNGDGRSDILWRNADGTVTDWLANANGTFASNHAVATYALDIGWNVAGSGDFNGDGRDDLLLRHANGTVVDWLGQANGGFVSNHAVTTYALGTNWALAGAGDFNGDGRDDVLWRNEVGAMSQWLGQANGSFAYNPAAAYQLPTNWQATATGDFNGDGRDDLLWRNEAGVMSQWLGQANGSFAYNPGAAYQLATSWTLAGSGDFNGDRRDDMLWRNADGVMSQWLANGDGTFTYNANAAYWLPTSWVLATVGDFNGDGREDIVWRNADGVLAQWLANPDATFAYNDNAAYQLSSNWRVQPGEPWL